MHYVYLLDLLMSAAWIGMNSSVTSIWEHFGS